MTRDMRRAVNKAKDKVEGIDFEGLWDPSEQGDVSGSIFTEETKDPDEKYASVFEVGDGDAKNNIDVGGDAIDVIKKGLGANVSDAIHDLQEAAATLAEIGDGLDNVGKAASCKSCGGKVSLQQRGKYTKLMQKRGWTPDSHKAFWSRISSSDDKGGSGGHRACVARMNGKVDDEHSFCSWAELEANGWPDKGVESAVQNVRKAAAGVSHQASELRKAMKGSK